MASHSVYHALEHDEFRIMRLYRSEQENSPLRCRLDCVRLSDRPKPAYNALSYVWGSAAFTVDLECGESTIRITESLRVCLNQLRTSDCDTILWVDQICINQKDIQERSAQVRIMGDIYRNAFSVMAWLGQDYEGYVATFKEFLDDIHLGQDGEPDIDCFVRNHLPSRESPKWRALGIMLSLPYFTRVWIMQEVVLARTVLFRWADLEFDRTRLRGLIDAASHADNWNGYDSLPVNRVDIHRAMSLTHFPPVRSLETVIYRVTHRNSTNPRDRIYAILGIIEDGPDIVPDYSASEMDVFRDVLFKTISLRENLNVLSSVTHSDESDLRPEEWPTWIPTWDKPIPTTIIELCSNYAVTSPSSFRPPVITNGGNAMSIQGLMCSTIEYVGMGPEGSKGPAEKIWDAWISASQFDPLKNFYGSELRRWFLWTLLCGWPEDGGGEHKEERWVEHGIFRDFASFWADTIARTVRFVHCGYEDPIPFVKERLPLADVLALQFRSVREAPSEEANSEANWKIEVGDDPDPSGYMEYRSGLYEKMAQKYDKSYAEFVSRELAYFYPGADWQKVDRMWQRTGLFRTFFILSDGLMGMGPVMMKMTDVVVVLSGGRVPYVLRPMQDGYIFLGECYVAGFMHENLEINENWVDFELL